jgi:peptidoglycan/LPS O-acetylase OafA/YrhL
VQLIAAQRLLGTARHLPARLERLIRWLGSSTFPMYAMHYPALCLFAALNPFARSSWLGILFVCSAVISVIALLTPVCEWLKNAIRRSLSRTPASRTTRVAMR